MPFKDADVSYESIVIEMLQRLQTEGILTDVNPGSVVRTLVEAFALELAKTYAQMSVIYDMGFVDTATDDSLDHLVALMGVQRIQGPQVVGEAQFSRDNAVSDPVPIPAGTLLYKNKVTGGQVQYRTEKDATLKSGQQSLTVSIVGVLPPASPSDAANPQQAAENAQKAISLTEDDVSKDDGLLTLAVAIPGVQTVRLLRPTALRQQRETDDQLRARTQAIVSAAGGGTANAIRQALLATGKVKTVTFPEPATPSPGTLTVAVDADVEADPALKAELTDAFNQAKAAGVVVAWQSIVTRPVSVRAVITPSDPLLDGQSREQLRQAVSQVLGQAIASLKPGETLRGTDLVAKVMKLHGIRDVKGDVTEHAGSKLGALPVPAGQLVDTFPPDGIRSAERLVLAPVRNPVTVLFPHEEQIAVQLITSASPAPQERAAVLAALDRFLAQGSASSQLTYSDMRQAVTTAVSDSASIFESQYLAFRVTFGGGITVVLTDPGDSTPQRVGANLRIRVDQEGSQWGVKRP